MILESFSKAEEDLRERQVRESRIEADAILAATDKARQSDAYFELTDAERAAITKAVNELLVVYHHDNYLLIRSKLDQLDQATLPLAESILKGTRIDA